jgi:hypothetical protein
MLQQVDVRLIPMLAALYLIAHLDRSNIGNTKVSRVPEPTYRDPQNLSPTRSKASTST